MLAMGNTGFTRVDGGLGLTSQQDINYGAQGAAIGASVGVASAASAGLITAATAAMAVPIVGAVIGGVALLLTAFGVGSGCGQTCINATHCANAASDYYKQINDAYFGNPNRTESDRQAAITAFNQVWAGMVQCCQQVPGSPGQRCVSERQRGGKYDSFRINLDPITNDTVATANTKATATGVVSAASGNIVNGIENLGSAIFGSGSNTGNAGAGAGGGGVGGSGLLIAAGVLVAIGLIS